MALDFSKSNNMINKVMGEANETDMDEKKRNISVDEIDENPMNEYLFGYDNQDFANEVIEEDGFHGVIEVCAMENGRYEILSGHRRFRACKANGYKTIPCVVNEYLPKDERTKRVIRGNILNRVLTPLNYARCLSEYEKILMNGPKEEQKGIRENMAKFFNISVAKVGRYLSLNNLIPEFQKLCEEVNYPYTNLMPVTAKSEEMQKKVYKSLEKIAPNGDIAQLSARIIEQQVNMVMLQEEREKSNKQINTRGVIPQNDAVMTDTPSPFFDEEITEQETKKNFQNNNDVFIADDIETDDEEDETEDDVFAEPEPIDMPGSFAEDENKVEEVYVPEKEKDEPRDREMNFYLDRIEIIAKGASFENKAKIIDRLKELLDILS